MLTHLNQSGQNKCDNLGNILLTKAFFEKHIEGEMVIRSQITTLLQKFREVSLYSQVILKSMRVADVTLLRNSECERVKAKSILYTFYHDHECGSPDTQTADFAQ